jgi:hypothetical protein
LPGSPARCCHHRPTTRIVGDAWTQERPFLGPVPARLLQHPVASALPPSVIDLAAHRLGEQVDVRDLAEYEVAL